MKRNHKFYYERIHKKVLKRFDVIWLTAPFVVCTKIIIKIKYL